MKYTVQDYVDGKIVIEKTTNKDMVEVMKLSGRTLDEVYGYPNNFEQYYWNTYCFNGYSCCNLKEDLPNLPIVKASDLLWSSKVGEIVLVWDNYEGCASERIFLGVFGGRYLCVDNGNEDSYYNGSCFSATSWKNCKPIPKEDPKEFTLQEIADKVGIPVEQLRIKK